MTVREPSFKWSRPTAKTMTVCIKPKLEQLRNVLFGSDNDLYDLWSYWYERKDLQRHGLEVELYAHSHQIRH